MQTKTPATTVETTARDHSNTLFASLELSKAKWLVTANSPGEEKFSQHIVAGGDGGSAQQRDGSGASLSWPWPASCSSPCGAMLRKVSFRRAPPSRRRDPITQVAIQRS
jgi:hypothetical protein